MDGFMGDQLLIYKQPCDKVVAKAHHTEAFVAQTIATSVLTTVLNKDFGYTVTDRSPKA